jgi:hypothetical protein
MLGSAEENREAARISSCRQQSCLLTGNTALLSKFRMEEDSYRAGLAKHQAGQYQKDKYCLSCQWSDVA